MGVDMEPRRGDVMCDRAHGLHFDPGTSFTLCSASGWRLEPLERSGRGSRRGGFHPSSGGLMPNLAAAVNDRTTQP